MGTKPADAPSQHSLMLRLAIASAIRRFEFDLEGIRLIANNIPASDVLDGLVTFDKSVVAAIDTLKEVKT